MNDFRLVDFNISDKTNVPLTLDHYLTINTMDTNFIEFAEDVDISELINPDNVGRTWRVDLGFTRSYGLPQKIQEIRLLSVECKGTWVDVHLHFITYDCIERTKSVERILYLVDRVTDEDGYIPF